MKKDRSTDDRSSTMGVNAHTHSGINSSHPFHSVVGNESILLNPTNAIMHVIARICSWFMTVDTFARHVHAIRLALAVTLIFCGCCANLIFLEQILNKDKRAGSLITICQFMFITLEGLAPQWIFKRMRRTIPLRYHLYMVLLFFTQAIINNWVFGFNISLPLHSLFRSGSLVMNLLIGWFFFKQRHSLPVMMCIVAITVGIAMATLESSKSEQMVFNEKPDPTMWTIGIVLLVVSQMISAVLGNVQSWVYGKFGRDWREGMFYSHLLSLPFFLFMADDLANHIAIFNASPVLSPAFPIPTLWFYLVLNVLTQYVCIMGVYSISALSNSLTLTLVITVRKFISILISTIWFDNSFSMVHWISVALVFGGSLLFSAFQSQKKSSRSSSSSSTQSQSHTTETGKESPDIRKSKAE